MVREQQDPPCETSAEQYEPTSVDTVLGNPTVTLEKFVDGEGLEEVMKAPTAADIAGLGEDYYLNLNGEALATPASMPGTSKSSWTKARPRSSTYAHIATRGGPLRLRPAVLVLLVLQPVQRPPRGRLGGDADQLRSGLPGRGAGRRTAPDHPLPARRRRARRLDRRQGPEGRHAPDRLPRRRLPRDLLRLRRLRRERPGRLGAGLRQHLRAAARTAPAAGPPARTTSATAAGSSGSATTAAGAKGKRATTTARPGPQTKTVWREPFTWMAGQRSTSPRLPGGSIVGPQVTKAFCGVVAEASNLINLDAKSRAGGDRHDRDRRCSRSRSSSASPAGARSTSSGCGRGAPSASWSAPRASSTAATGWSSSRSA